MTFPFANVVPFSMLQSSSDMVNECFYHMQSSEQELIVSITDCRSYQSIWSKGAHQSLLESWLCRSTDCRSKRSIRSKAALESKSWLCRSTDCQSYQSLDLIEDSLCLANVVHCVWRMAISPSCQSALGPKNIHRSLSIDTINSCVLQNIINSSMNNLQGQIIFTNVNVLMTLPFAKQCYIRVDCDDQLTVNWYD